MRAITGLLIFTAAILFIFLLFRDYPSLPGPSVTGESWPQLQETEPQQSDTTLPLGGLKYNTQKGEFNLINPVKNSLDSLLLDFCSRFPSKDIEQRTQLRKSLSIDELYTLINFGKRSSVFALREKETAYLKGGLFAISMISYGHVDFRDLIIPLGLLYHSASRIDANIDTLFRHAASLSDHKISELFTDYLKLPPGELNIREYCKYAELETQYGIGFIEWGIGDYHPTYNFVNILLDIARVIEADRYQSSSIELASELPSAWFPTPEKTKLDNSLNRIRACASISADLRLNNHQKIEAQQFTAFLVEVEDQATASFLIDIVNKQRSSTIAKIAIARKTLFCLVTARSYMKGMNNLETTKSLRRFLKPLTAVLDHYTQTIE